MEEINERRRRRQERRRRRRLLLGGCILICILFAVTCQRVSAPTKERRQVDEISGIPVVTDFVSAETMARPGEERRVKYIVIHETGNAGKNANAASHNRFLHDAADAQTTSWHYTVDDHEIYHHIPDNEVAFHAGDGIGQDSGNLNGIGIEMCINPENDYEQTLKNAAALAAFLIEEYDLDLEDLKKHEDFSGKHCPDLLLNANRWNEFVQMVKDDLEKRK